MTESRPVPDFVIAGLPKCGTTTLYHWLKDHPDLFMPDGKEPHFFAPYLSDRYCRVRDEDTYRTLFEKAGPGQICGEASVLYAFSPDSLRAVLDFNPAARLILMLRNPVAMAPSYHGQLLVNLEEDEDDFEKAWDLQEDRRQGRSVPPSSTDSHLLQYQTCCSAGEHLERFMEIVPEKQRLVLLLDDLARDASGTYRAVLEFLGVRDDGRRQFGKANEGAVLRSRLLQRWITDQPGFIKPFKPFLKRFLSSALLHKLNRKPSGKRVLSADFEAKLYDIFQQDIEKVERLLGRDLKAWRRDAV